jgi:H+/Cl- antiporter ClcA
VGRTEVGSHSGRGEMICRDLYVTGKGFKKYLTLMMMRMVIIIIIIIIATTTTITTATIIIIIIIFTMTKMIMVIIITMMMIYLFRAANNDMSISELHMENKLNRLNKIFKSTHKQVKA